MKKGFIVLFAALAAVMVFGADTEITIQRADSKINAGFKARVYIDGRQALTLANGQSAKVRIAQGDHVIHVELYTLTTQKLQFNTGSDPVLTIVPYSAGDLGIESGGGALAGATVMVPAAPARPAPVEKPAKAPPPEKPAKAPPAEKPVKAAPAPKAAVSTAGGVEGSLLRAAEVITVDMPAKSQIAIVYVTAADPEVAEFIAGELEFIMVQKKLVLVDRSQLDRIRQEQKFQLSGEVDDRRAVSIGKMSGANIIVTGAVTGTGELRRLRLRTLDTQTAELLAVASERY